MLDYKKLEVWEKEAKEHYYNAVSYRSKVVSEIVDLLDKAMLFTNASDTIKVNGKDENLYETLKYIQNILSTKT